jgi:hypothetical protein
MGIARRTALVAVAAALVAPAGAHAAPRRPVGLLIMIKPTVTRNALDVATRAYALGPLAYPYVATFTLKGTINGAGYSTVIDDQWTVVVHSAAQPPVVHHTYPAAPNSDIALFYSGHVAAVMTGATTPCSGALVRISGSTPVDTKGC